MSKLILPYDMLIYDIENSKVKYRAFQGGEQFLRHKQLCSPKKYNEIICISAKWYNDNKIMTFVGETAVEEFFKLVEEADVVLGKNNNSFDNKHVNTHRMLQKLPSKTPLKFLSEDLETQLRRNFKFQSYSLDHVSDLLLGAGKDKMEDSDWNDIQDMKELELIDKTLKKPDEYCRVMYNGRTRSQVMYHGRRALRKMIKYNKTDVLRTEQVLVRIMPYIELRYNVATKDPKEVPSCKLCGSLNVSPFKIIVIGQTKYQEFFCKAHNGYAGKATFKWDKQRHKKFGKIT